MSSSLSLVRTLVWCVNTARSHVHTFNSIQLRWCKCIVPAFSTLSCPIFAHTQYDAVSESETIVTQSCHLQNEDSSTPIWGDVLCLFPRMLHRALHNPVHRNPVFPSDHPRRYAHLLRQTNRYASNDVMQRTCGVAHVSCTVWVLCAERSTWGRSITAVVQ